MAKLNFSIALGLAANKFKQGLNGVQNQLKGFASSVKSMFGMIAGAFAVGQIKSFAQECMDAYSAQMQAEQKLTVIMKQRMGVSDAEVESVLKLASAQQELGVIGDEVQLAGAQQVATFLNDKKSLDTLLPAMNNLLAQQKGLNATQGDAVNIGNLMGKVMQGQTSALKRVGISFTEAEEKVLKFGTEEQKAAMLAEVIKNNVGDMNAALAQTDAGKMQQLSNTLGDLKEKIGAALMPIMGQLAPMISNFATNGANAIVGFINTVQQNVQALVGFIVMQFAGIGLVKIFSRWLASFKSLSAQLEATAAASTTKRLAYEQRLNSQKIALLKLEAAHDEAIGKKKKAIAAQVTAKKAELAAIEKALNEAKNAEIVAQEELAAFETASAWKKAMLTAKLSFIGFMTTVKTLFRSFAPLLIFEILFTVGMKVYEMLSKNSKGFMALAKVVGGAVMSAISLLADGLAKIFDYVADLFGLVEKNGKKYRSKKTGKVYDSMEELNAAEGKKGKKGTKDTKIIPGSNDQYSSNQDLLDALGNAGKGGNKEKTPKEQAKEDVAKAEKDYSSKIKKSIATIEIATKTYGESEQREKVVIEEKQNQANAIKSLYDTYSEAWAITGKEGYYKRMEELMVQIDTMSVDTEGASELLKEMQDDIKEKSDFRKSFAESKAKNKETEAKQRDTTFDYKLTGQQVAEADLEFKLDKAKTQLDELKQYAESGCAEAIKAIADAEKNVTSLEEDLKLAKVKKDVDDLQKQIRNLSWEGVQQGWSVVEGTVNDITSLVEKLEDPDTNGWEKFAAVVSTTMGVVQTFIGVMQTLNAITELSNQLQDAKTKATEQETIAKQAKTAATITDTAATVADNTVTETSEAVTAAKTVATVADNTVTETSEAVTAAKTVTTEAETEGVTKLATAEVAIATATPIATAALGTQAAAAATGGTTSATAAVGYTTLAKSMEVEAATAIFAAHASIPFAGVPVASGFVTTMEGVLTGVKTAASAMKFSTGGVVRGASPVGDFVPALLNSNEMVLNTTQQSRLFQLANGAGTVNQGPINLRLKVRGRDLITCEDNEARISAISGKKVNH